MRLFVFFASLISFVWVIADEKEFVADVWINGGSELEIQRTNSRTIYFPSWNETVADLRMGEGYFLALQLDDRFDPKDD